ncbi:hypothetical protein BH09VER1_BH09VER1_46120 [soil metagenome]
MLPRPSRYPLVYKLIVLGLWLPPLVLLALDRDGSLRRPFLEPFAWGDRLVLVVFWLLVLPVLAVALHLTVWLSSKLRRSCQPRWTSHGFALLALALPVVTVVSFLQGRPPLPPIDAEFPPPYRAGPVDSSPAANPFQAFEPPPPPHRPAPLPRK